MTVCLDSDCVIYLVEGPPVWEAKVTARLAALRAAGDAIAVSDLARTECLAGPLSKSDAVTLANYHTYFSSGTVQVLSLTPAVCERAAHLRAASNFKLKVPDCLHLAAAIEHGCGLFLTHDAQLKQCTAITVEILS
jgi:predicted nucleic acid-binding protein